MPSFASFCARFSVARLVWQYTIPLCPARFRRNSRSRSYGRCFASIRYVRFGRLKLATYTPGSRNPSCWTMSARTRSVAVAVSAISGVSGNRSRSSASCRYSGRKSCPQSLMQCASSIANIATFHEASRARNCACISRSGATYSSRNSPRSRPAITCCACAHGSVEFSIATAIPCRRSESTWSFISAISGDTTTVSPGRTSAGS